MQSQENQVASENHIERPPSNKQQQPAKKKVLGDLIP